MTSAALRWQLSLWVAYGGLAVAALQPQCPGSPALIHAKTTVQGHTTASCDDVATEVEARVAGQWATWHDPHNNGTYTLLQAETLGPTKMLKLKRLTGNKLYTDKMVLTMQPSSAGGCELAGCSESQVFSVEDFSTNYCNLRMLYCGSADGCHPVLHDFQVQEDAVHTSIGAGRDRSACLRVMGYAFLARTVTRH